MKMNGLIGGIAAGLALVSAANLAGIVAHYGLLPNGNPANPYALFLIGFTIVCSAVACWLFHQ